MAGLVDERPDVVKKLEAYTSSDKWRRLTDDPGAAGNDRHGRPNGAAGKKRHDSSDDDDDDDSEGRRGEERGEGRGRVVVQTPLPPTTSMRHVKVKEGMGLNFLNDVGEKVHD